MTSISAVMIALNEEEFIKPALESLEYVVDEIIVVDGGSTDATLDICDEFKKVKVFHKKWRNDYGAQREYCLKQAKGDWYLSIDADEVLSDDGFLLKEIAENPETNNYNIIYEHFVRDFGHIDITCNPHVGIRRFFKNLPSINYPRKMHEIAESPDFLEAKLLPPEVKLFHCGYLKSITSIKKKYEKNLVQSQVHSKDFLHNWYYAHLLGMDVDGVLKIGQYKGAYPQPLKEAYKLP